MTEPKGPTDEEIEERFHRWWFNEGSGMRPFNGEDQEECVHRVSQIAWKNGAYVARFSRPAFEPEPEEPTNEELKAAVRKALENYKYSTEIPYFLDGTEEEPMMIALRAVACLTRCGRPAAQPETADFDPRLIALATTSEQIPPGPYSEHELRTQWNAQADEFNQWESLDLSEQLAWAQARAITADRKSHAIALAQPAPSADGEVAELVAALEADAECVEVVHATGLEHQSYYERLDDLEDRIASLEKNLSKIARPQLGLTPSWAPQPAAHHIAQNVLRRSRSHGLRLGQSNVVLISYMMLKLPRESILCSPLLLKVMNKLFI